MRAAHITGARFIDIWERLSAALFAVTLSSYLNSVSLSICVKFEHMGQDLMFFLCTTTFILPRSIVRDIGSVLSEAFCTPLSLCVAVAHNC